MTVPTSVPPTESQIRSQIDTLLGRSLLCCLSIQQAGQPRSWMVYFASRGSSDLVFVTAPGSSVSRALLPGREVSVGIFNDQQPWGEPHCGVRMLGAIAKLAGTEASEASRAYTAKFPKSQILVDGGHFDLYAIRVSTVHLVDENSFGSTSYTLQVGA